MKNGSTSAAMRFACDAMCGGLARWLRALGYDATFAPDITDADLVALAQAEGRILISSDSRLFERRLLRDGVIHGLFLPRGLKRLDQVRFVVERLRLPTMEPRCMACGGALVVVGPEDVGDRVPAKSLLGASEFFECECCRKVFWNGSHWRRIAAVRQAAPQWAAGRDPPEPLPLR
jgi:uncharacterized protein with PIN domain